MSTNPDETVKELVEQQHNNLIMIAEAVGVEDRHLESKESSESKAFKAALGGGAGTPARKDDTNDDEDLAELFLRNNELIHLAADAAGVSERNLEGEADPQSDETKAFKSRFQ